MQTMIVKWGNSQGIRIPKIFLENINISENDPVDITLENEKIIIKKANSKKHKTTKEHLVEFYGDDFASKSIERKEIDWGEPAGPEHYAPYPLDVIVTILYKKSPEGIMDINKIRAQFNHAAQKYDSHRKCFIPCFDDFYKASVSLLKQYKTQFRHIVDLGAGTGLLTMEIYKLYNSAHFTLIDLSKDMLQIARERFDGLNNFDFIENNYVENIPVKDCDLICSALSIHHLENEDKIRLYKDIFRKLDKDGCFINLDQFIGTSEEINKMYNAWWYNYIDRSGIKEEEKSAWIERKKLDRENTIKETMELLRESGFKNVECIYSFMKFGVIIAIKG